MNRFAFISLYRSLTRHKLYSALNVGGLAVGISVFLVLGLYVRFETSFEHWLPNHDKIYVVRTIWNLPGSVSNGASPYTMGGLLEQMREDFPGVVGTRIRGGEAAGSVIRGGVATAEDMAQVDPTFFSVFDLAMVKGNGSTALLSPSNIILSEAAARKYFGNTNPIGQTMTLAFDAPANYRVAGVFRDLPRNSDFKLAILAALPSKPPARNWYHWGSSSLQTFLHFDTPDSARAFEDKLHAFVDRRAMKDLGQDAWNSEKLDLMPLDRLHLEPDGNGSASRKMTVVTLGIVGVLTLLIAIVNYVNLATARAGLRAREVAMRKVLGADQGALVRQFLGEAIVTVALAALAGLMLAELGLPLVNAAGGLDLDIPYGLVFPALALLVAIVGMTAGLYPAIVLARFNASTVLASARVPGGGRAGTRTREALVIFQFVLAIAFTIGTTVLVAQTQHVRRSDLGFKREGLLVVKSLRDPTIPVGQRRSVLAGFRAIPGVSSVAVANSAVGGSGEDNADNVPLPGVPGPGPNLRWIITGPGFFQTYGARLLAGRLFDNAHGADDSHDVPNGQASSIIINRQAIAALHFRSASDAIGKTVGGAQPRTIVGVVDDMRFFSPREPVGPTYHYYYRNAEEASSPVASIRFSGDPRAVLASVRGVWQRMVPQVPFDGGTADKRLDEFYEADDRATRMFGIGAGLAVLIGCVGLWGLASFNTSRRVREIGIRKTLGASSTNIVALLVGQFLRPVLIANLVAWPIAFAATRAWLAGFDDRIALSPLFFVGPSLLAVIIAMLTVLGQSLHASRAAPAWALRHD